jgi:hypothetical protein
MDLGQIIKYAPAVLEGVAVVTGTILLVEYDDEIFDKIKSFRGRRRIKRGQPPYSKKYEYGQLYLNFMKDYF